MSDLLKSKLEELREKQEEAARLRRALDRSLLLQTMWPSVFDNGPVTTKWVGVAPQKTYRKQPEHKNHTFYIEDGKGEVREFSYSEVLKEFGGGL